MTEDFNAKSIAQTMTKQQSLEVCQCAKEEMA